MADRQCTARSKRTGNRCGNTAMRGQLVCRMHGGSAKQNRAAGGRRQAEDAAAAEVARRWPDREVTDYLDELGRIAGEVVGFKDYLREQVDALDSLVMRFTDADSDESGSGFVQVREDVRAIVAAYERALDRSVKTLAAMAKLNIEDRLAKVQETQAEQVSQAVRAALSAGQLEPGQVRAVEAELGVRLRALTAG